MRAVRLGPGRGYRGDAVKVCMFLYSPFRHDSRVLKEARTLAEAGHDVRVVAALDEGTAALERRDGFTIVRVDRDPLPTKALRTLVRARRSGGGDDRGTPAAGAGDDRGTPGAGAGDAACGEHLFFGHGHRLGFALDELDAAGRASRVAAAGVQDVDARVLLDRQHQPLAVLDVHRTETFDCELGHH